MQNGPLNGELSVRAAGIAELSNEFNRKMGNICLELLKKATLCAAAMGLIAGLGAVVFFRP